MAKGFAEHRNADQPMGLDPRHTAVLVVDMINDFCTQGGAMVLPGAEKLYGPQNAVMRAAREAGSPVIHIVDTHRPNMVCDREFLKRTPHCMEGEWGAQIVDQIERGPRDFVVIKRRYSGFFNTDLDLTLKDLQVDTLVVMAWSRTSACGLPCTTHSSWAIALWCRKTAWRRRGLANRPLRCTTSPPISGWSARPIRPWRRFPLVRRSKS
ncbi:isochorismatase family protein [Pusillimonas noertemannii]|uniref:Isochorismatase family protein n=1 Tax=Pusillimonas noertemannii TaxID=305977 RepID=A0A2U1CIP6_9BURK|nr:isochorismatase family cysteine hydrolase [Pusillimonas noertemannii]PVY60876.1 isochorismatase family protein [Pusillimonas noertemannii]